MLAMRLLRGAGRSSTLSTDKDGSVTIKQTGSYKVSPTARQAALQQKGRHTEFASRPVSGADAWTTGSSAIRITPIIDSPRRNQGKEVATKFEEARWIRPGELAAIADIKITSGLFYLGSKLSSESFRTENCLINPSLPIASIGRASADGLNYWPSYSELKPPARRAFLEWMAEGRVTPSAEMGLVFIFFYGLEYRLFKERATPDAAELIAEVERLLKIYGASSSFQSYARRFLGAARALGASSKGTPEISFERTDWQEIPVNVRVHLGEKLAQGASITGEDGLLWLTSMPDTWFRTPVTRCPEEFRHLWNLRFASLYPDGFAVSVPKSKISVRYRAASGTFEVPIHGEHETLPDISVLKAPVKKLRELLDACTSELDPYSRYLGRKPVAARTAAAIVLLPSELRGNRLGEFATRFAAIFEGEDIKVTTPRRLLAVAEIPVADDGKGLGSALSQLAPVLDAIDIAVEPDRRYGGGTATLGSPICVFKAKGGAPIEAERPEYRIMRTITEISLLAAAADGAVRSDERDALVADIQASSGLNGSERLRLLACATAFHETAPKSQKLLKKLETLELTERQAVARSAIAVVLADGRVTPEEVRFLERLYKALRLPVDDVYSALHRGDVEPNSAASPVKATETATTGANGSRPRTVGVTIDPDRLARLREETKAVSSLLSDVFNEDTEIARDESKTLGEASATPNLSDFAGLDEAHSSLLKILLDEGALSRQDFEARAHSLKLLAGGALEHVNDWAFEHFDEPLIEDGDKVMIVSHLRDRVAEMKDAAK
jgi:tellurite resistance protein